jgi:hypothetical protein
MLLLIGAFAAAPAQATDLDTNLIVNPGAEADTGATGVDAHTSNVGITGWTKSGRATVIEYDAEDWGGPTSSDPGPADRGLNFFAGGDEALSSISQTFDVRDLDIQIDGGQVDFDLEGWFGGWEFHEDNATLTAYFLDAGGFEIDSVAIGPATLADRGSDTKLLFYETGGSIPALTRDIDLTLEMVRLEGDSNDGYADNLSFVLTVIPEPSTVLLLGMGLGGLGLAGRRSGGPRRS